MAGGRQGESSRQAVEQGSGTNPGGTYGPGGDHRLQNHLLHPTMRPPAGLHGAAGVYRTGRIYALPDDTVSNGAGLKSSASASKWAFNFLYNPGSISVSTSINWDLNFDPNSPVAVLPNAQQINFELLLNRIADISDPDPKRRVPTGTLHDIEYLYRVINGSPTNQGEMGITADRGFITPQRVLVAFGSKFKYTGYIQSINIQHVMFQRDMIPVYSTVDISMSRALGSSNGDGSGGTDSLPQALPGNGSSTGGGYTGA